jgi:hypothetical protein
LKTIEPLSLIQTETSLAVVRDTNNTVIELGVVPPNTKCTNKGQKLLYVDGILPEPPKEWYIKYGLKT